MGELQWLAASSLMTASLWLLYVPNRLVVLGLWRTMGNPATSDPPLAPWAQRAHAAHRNAVENLAVFAALLLAAVALDLDGALTGTCAQAYFLARAVHVGAYVAGVPVIRTLAFAASWAAQVAIALRILGGI